MKLTNEQLQHYRDRFVTACELITAAKAEFNNTNFFNVQDDEETTIEPNGFEVTLIRNSVGCRFRGSKFIALYQNIDDDHVEVYGEMSRKNARNRKFFYAIEDSNTWLELHRWEWSKDDGFVVVK